VWTRIQGRHARGHTETHACARLQVWVDLGLARVGPCHARLALPGKQVSSSRPWLWLGLWWFVVWQGRQRAKTSKNFSQCGRQMGLAGYRQCTAQDHQNHDGTVKPRSLLSTHSASWARPRHLSQDWPDVAPTLHTLLSQMGPGPDDRAQTQKDGQFAREQCLCQGELRHATLPCVGLFPRRLHSRRAPIAHSYAWRAA
jgi:hypothetical protein